MSQTCVGSLNLRKFGLESAWKVLELDVQEGVGTLIIFKYVIPNSSLLSFPAISLSFGYQIKAYITAK